MRLQTENLTFCLSRADGGERARAGAGRRDALRIERGQLRGGAGAQRLRQVHAGQAYQRRASALGRQGVRRRDGHRATRRCCSRSAARVGMVFQNPDNQIVANVVEEDVAFAPENLGVPPEEIRRRVDDALTAVGMEEFTAARAAPALRRTEAARGHRGRDRHASPECIVLDEADRHARPRGPARGHLTPSTRLNRERGHHGRAHHPPHERGRSRPTA